MKINQRQKIINHIRQYGSLTSLEATTILGITQFATRISELEELGYEFKKEWESRKNKNGEIKHFKRYYLADMVAENMNHIPQI